MLIPTLANRVVTLRPLHATDGEALQCVRVQLTTDVINEHSRQAILRLSASQEGIIRNGWIMPEAASSHLPFQHHRRGMAGHQEWLTAPLACA